MDRACGNLLKEGVEAALGALGRELLTSSSKVFKSEEAQHMMKDLATNISDKYKKSIQDMAADNKAVDVDRLDEMIDIEVVKAMRDYDASVAVVNKFGSWIDKADSVDDLSTTFREFRQRGIDKANAERTKFHSKVNEYFDNMKWAGKFTSADQKVAKKMVLDQHKNPFAIRDYMASKLRLEGDELNRAIFNGLRDGRFDGDSALNLVFKFATKVDEDLNKQIAARAPGFESPNGHALPYDTSSSKISNMTFSEFEQTIKSLGIRFKGDAEPITDAKVIRDIYNKWSDPTPGAYRKEADSLIKEQPIEIPKDKEYDFVRDFTDIESYGIWNSFMLSRERKAVQLANVEHLGFKRDFVHKILHKEMLARRPDLVENLRAREDLKNELNQEIKNTYMTTGDISPSQYLLKEAAATLQGFTSFALLPKVGLRTSGESFVAGVKAGKVNNASVIAATSRIIWNSAKRAIRKGGLKKQQEAYAQLGVQLNMDLAHLIGAGRVRSTDARGRQLTAEDADFGESRIAGWGTWLGEFGSDWSGANYLFRAQRVGILSGVVNPTVHKILKGKNLSTAEKAILEGSGLDDAARNALQKANRLDDPNEAGLKIGINPEKPFDLDNPEVAKALKAAKRPSEISLEQTAYRLMNDEAEMANFITVKMQTITQEAHRVADTGRMGMFFRFLNMANSEWMNFINVFEMASGRFAGMNGGLGGTLKKLYHSKSKAQLMWNLAKISGYAYIAGSLLSILKDVATGREPRDITSWDNALDSWLNIGGGGLGYFLSTANYNGEILSVPFWSALKHPYKANKLALKYLFGDPLTPDEEAQLYQAIKKSSGFALNGWMTSKVADKAATDLLGLEIETKGSRRYRKELGNLSNPQFDLPFGEEKFPDRQRDLLEE